MSSGQSTQPAPRSQRVLITGGAGFIGSHLCEALLARGHTVTIIDDLSTGRFENIAHLADHPRFNFAIDSITNEVVLDRLASECGTIFHLAAAVGVKLIVEHPVHTINTNVMGTEAVLKAALRYRARADRLHFGSVRQGQPCAVPRRRRGRAGAHQPQPLGLRRLQAGG